jgi:hypothetical protein
MQGCWANDDNDEFLNTYEYTKFNGGNVMLRPARILWL